MADIDIEEIEKNINYIEDMLHNLFKFKIKLKEKTITYAEAILTHELLLKKKRYYEAGEIAGKFFEEYVKAMLLSESYTISRKATFNTLRSELKNVIRNNK